MCFSGVGRSTVLTHTSFTPVTVKACMLAWGGGREREGARMREREGEDRGPENDTPMGPDYGEQEE